MFFENRDIKGEIQASRNTSHIFPAHFHLDLEVLLLKKGKYVLAINDEEYEVESGSVVAIDSYDVHWYKTYIGDEDRDSCVVVIPYKCLERFNAQRGFFKIKSPIVKDERLCNKLLSIADEYLSPKNSEEIKEAAVELFLSLLCENLEFSSEKTGEEGVLIRSILAYIQENYRGKISLSLVAKHLGYTPAHVSRAFHKYIKMSLPEYVNRLRLEYIDKQKAKDDKRKIVDLIYEAGFNSEQTYYRQRQRASNVPLHPDFLS